VSRVYPRIDDAAPKPQWERARIKNPKNIGPVCCVFQAPATHRVFVEVSIFRGDDEGPFNTCKDHRRDADSVLASRQAKAPNA